MDIRQLRYFVEIVDQGSLSRAASKLNVAQSALSIHLRNMENMLQTRLLSRGRNGVKATEAGEVLLRHARLILSEHASAVDEIHSLGRQPTGEVRLGLTGTISDLVTVPLIEAVERLYPGIRLNVSEAMSGFVADWLRDNRVDLAILYVAPDEPALAARRLLEEQLVLIAPPGSSGGEQVTVNALAEKPLILPSRAHGLRMVLEDALQPHGGLPKPSIEIDSYNNIKTLVARGHGISVLPLHAVAADHEAGRLHLRLFEAPELYRSVWLVWHARKPMSRSVKLVQGLIEQTVARLVEEGRWSGARLAEPRA